MSTQCTRSLLYRRIQAGCLAAAVIGPLGLANVLAAGDKPATPKPPTAFEKFKNIKVLKDLPASQLMPVMFNYNASLGVRCGFCHVIKADHTGFESDENPMKNVARSMITMTRGLNQYQKTINNKATCYMCHRGKSEPVTEVPVTAGG